MCESCKNKSRNDIAIILLACILSLPLAPAIAQEGDPELGARLYQRCYACHSLNPDETGLQGPTLHGVVGRSAGSVEGFGYSAALRARAAEGLVWTREALDRYLGDPEAMIPGTAMAVNGVRDPAERASLIAYLTRAGRRRSGTGVKRE